MSFRETAYGPMIDKDPDDILDYVIDMSAWLAEGDQLSGVLAEVISGDVTIDTQSVNGAPVVVKEAYGDRTIAAQQAAVIWLSGGSEHTTSSVRVRMTTQQGRRRDATFIVNLVSR